MYNIICMLIVGGSHQATLKELSRVRNELLLAKAERAGTAREDNTSVTSKVRAHNIVTGCLLKQKILSEW